MYIFDKRTKKKRSLSCQYSCSIREHRQNVWEGRTNKVHTRGDGRRERREEQEVILESTRRRRRCSYRYRITHHVGTRNRCDRERIQREMIHYINTRPTIHTKICTRAFEWERNAKARRQIGLYVWREACARRSPCSAGGRRHEKYYIPAKSTV